MSLKFSKAFMDECRAYGECHLIRQTLLEIERLSADARGTSDTTAREQARQASLIKKLTAKAVTLDQQVQAGLGRWRRGKSTKGKRMKP